MNLSSLPKLPDLLTELDCSNNQLTSLSELPNSLTKLWCDKNKLTTLPKLPDSLTAFGCSNNQLTTLPKLPDSLEVLWCDDNPWDVNFQKIRKRIPDIQSYQKEMANQEFAKSWKTFISKNGQPYYYNTKTGERTYDKPS